MARGIFVKCNSTRFCFEKSLLRGAVRKEKKLDRCTEKREEV